MLGTGGNTTMQRTYPERIFLARDLLSAIEFVQFQCGDYRSPFVAGMLSAQGILPKRRSELDVWRVKLPEGTTVHADVLFPSVAGWIDVAVPADHVSLVGWWVHFERMWRVLRKAGIT